jgi:hypothetical protein
MSKEARLIRVHSGIRYLMGFLDFFGIATGLYPSGDLVEIRVSLSGFRRVRIHSIFEGTHRQSHEQRISFTLVARGSTDAYAGFQHVQLHRFVSGEIG